MSGPVSFTAVTDQADTTVASAASVLYGIVVSAGATATVVIVRNATDNTAEAFRINAAANTTVIQSFPNGILFPTALRLDVDANTVSATVFWQDYT